MQVQDYGRKISPAFVLQRSADNNSWKDIYTLNSNGLNKKKLEKFYDRNPEPAKNYYRLKIFVNNETEYTASIMVIIGSQIGRASCRERV